MTEAEKLKRDIDTCKESIRLDRLALATKLLKAEERTMILASIDALNQEVAQLRRQLDKISN